MDLLDLLSWPIWVAITLVAIQCVRLAFADADLTLLWKAMIGKKPTCLAGQVVWISGASSGIGESLAYELARAGCRLVLSARRKEELERVKKQCLIKAKAREDDIYVLPMDIMKLDSHKDAVDEVIRKFKKIDILVNNAGRSQRALLKDTLLAVDQEMMNLNHIGLISHTKAVLPHMLKNKRGQIVVTSSVAGKMGAPMSASYSASKFALHGWFEVARIELAASNIDITLVCPGPVFSKVQADAFTETLDKSYGVDMEKHERRLSAERCAELMAVAIANRLDEVWISLQPILLITYMVQYMPSTYRMFAKILGKNMALLKKWRK